MIGARRLPGEWHDIEAPPHGVVDAVEHRLVVANDQQLQRWQELELVLPHEPSPHLVATSELLDTRLGPGSSLFGFARGHGSRAPEGGYLGRMPVVLSCRECFDGGSRRIICQDPGQNVEERPLAVPARAVDEN